MSCITYILPQHNLTLLSDLMTFFFLYIVYTITVLACLLFDFIVFRLVSYHINVEVAQKETSFLPEDDIVLPKHVGATHILKRKIKKCRTQGIFVVTLYT
jgi:hypothetical protein